MLYFDKFSIYVDKIHVKIKKMHTFIKTYWTCIHSLAVNSFGIYEERERNLTKSSISYGF